MFEWFFSNEKPAFGGFDDSALDSERCGCDFVGCCFDESQFHENFECLTGFYVHFEDCYKFWTGQPGLHNLEGFVFGCRIEFFGFSFD